MFPLNRPYDPYYQLGDDDVRGIRFLYAPWTWSYRKYSSLFSCTVIVCMVAFIITYEIFFEIFR